MGLSWQSWHPTLAGTGLNLGRCIRYLYLFWITAGSWWEVVEDKGTVYRSDATDVRAHETPPRPRAASPALGVWDGASRHQRSNTTIRRTRTRLALASRQQPEAPRRLRG